MTEPTARQRLLAAMRARTCFCGADSCHNAEEYVDAYAHELADQIREKVQRQQAEQEQRFGKSDHESQLQWDAVRDAADLIDPEVQP